MSVLKNASVMWAQVIQPDTKFEPQWHITAILNKEQQDQLINESKSIDPKGKGIKLKEDEQGNKIYRFRRRVARASGDGENNAPLVCGPKGKDDKWDKLIGNGSVCNIQYRFVPYENKFGKGVTVDLCGVQVIDHVPYGAADGDEFGSAESSESSAPTSTNEFDDNDF